MRYIRDYTGGKKCGKSGGGEGEGKIGDDTFAYFYVRITTRPRVIYRTDGLICVCICVRACVSQPCVSRQAR